MAIHPITDRVWVKPTEKKTKLNSGLYYLKPICRELKEWARSQGRELSTL